MKIICTTENLKNTVLTAERFTGKHITLPILSYILFSVKDKKTIITATNLEIGIESEIPSKVQKTGSVTAPAKSISQILQSIQDQTVTLEADDQKLTLYTPSSEITLHGLNPDDFPSQPKIKAEYSFGIPGQDFISALEQVIPAAAVSDVKPELAGIFISLQKDTVTFTATDSFRLAEKHVTLAGMAGAAGDFIIPVRTAQELTRTVPHDADISVSIGEHQALFAWEGTRVVSRLIDGAFPPYKNLFPSTHETTQVVNRDELMKKVKLASVFSSRLNDITFKFSSDDFSIMTANAETGGTTSHLKTNGRGKAGSVVFNYRYLMDGINAIPEEFIELSINGVAGPTLLKGPSDASYRYLIMPIRSV